MSATTWNRAKGSQQSRQAQSSQVTQVGGQHHDGPDRKVELVPRRCCQKAPKRIPPPPPTVCMSLCAARAFATGSAAEGAWVPKGASGDATEGGGTVV